MKQIQLNTNISRCINGSSMIKQKTTKMVLRQQIRLEQVQEGKKSLKQNHNKVLSYSLAAY